MCLNLAQYRGFFEKLQEKLYGRRWPFGSKITALNKHKINCCINIKHIKNVLNISISTPIVMDNK